MLTNVELLLTNLELPTQQLGAVLSSYINPQRSEERTLTSAELAKNLQAVNADQRFNLLADSSGSSRGNTFLHNAAGSGHVEIVKCVFEHIASVEQKLDLAARTNFNGETVLHLTTKHGHDAVMKYVLSALSMEARCTLLGIKNKRGDTPLHIASQSTVQKIKCLLDSIAAERASDVAMIQNFKNKTLLHYSSLTAARVKCILDFVLPEYRLPLLTLKDIQGYTPLHYAAKTSPIDEVKHMVDSTVPENTHQLFMVQDEDKQTPLHIA